MKGSLLVCILALAGCTETNQGGADGITGEELPRPRNELQQTTYGPPVPLEILVRERAFWDQPTLNPTTRFEIDEYQVEGLQEAMNLRLLLIRYLSPDGEQFETSMQIYRDGVLTTFGSTFGSYYGLLSAAMADDRLFYTYSFGCGFHVSHVGAISIRDGHVQIAEASPLIGWDESNTVDMIRLSDGDVFVRKVNGDLFVEVGDYVDFNSWEKSKVLGEIKVTEDSFSIIGLDGIVDEAYPK